MLDVIKRMGFLYWLTWQFLRLHFNLWHRLKVIGAENIPLDGGVILASNHSSHLDSPPIGISVPRVTRFVADIGMNRRFILLRIFGKALNVIYFKRGETGSEMIEESVKALKKGDAVIIYPEGTRSRTGLPSTPRTGIIHMASRAGVPIIPTRVSGTFEIMPPGSTYHPWGKIQVAFGTPITIKNPGPELDEKDEFIEEADMVMSEILKLPGWYPKST